MKKTTKTIICLILCFAVVFSLASCGGIMELLTGGNNRNGYTGGMSWGDPHAYSNVEIYWLETYDEAVTAIEGLKAAGNEIPEGLISDYESDLVDAKYLFVVNTHKIEKRAKDTKWYDHKYKAVDRVEYYGFLDKISIEELEYSETNDYRFVCASNDGKIKYVNVGDKSAVLPENFEEEFTASLESIK